MIIPIFQIDKSSNALIFGNVKTMLNEVISHFNQNKADNTELWFFEKYVYQRDG